MVSGGWSPRQKGNMKTFQGLSAITLKWGANTYIFSSIHDMELYVAEELLPTYKRCEEATDFDVQELGLELHITESWQDDDGDEYGYGCTEHSVSYTKPFNIEYSMVVVSVRDF